MKKKRVILSAGGTGGHLFPAKALAEQLSEEYEILFVAGGLSTSPYFDKTLPYREIDVATFSFSKPLQVLKGGIKVARGISQAKRILSDFNPDLVIGFGSFYTLPMLVAAKLANVPFLLHEQNALPGKVNRLFSRYAKTTGITFPNSSRYLKGKSITVAFPLRKRKDESSAWEYYGLEKRPTLLVFGGSQGARAINQQMVQSASYFKNYQIVHFTGKHGECDKVKKAYDAEGIISCVKKFEERFDLALAIADFAICRAGASTIAELIKSELPAILIPFPYASENHQVNNASFFVDVVKGGKMLLEKEIEKLHTLLPLDLETYRRNIAHHRANENYIDFAQLIKEL